MNSRYNHPEAVVEILSEIKNRKNPSYIELARRMPSAIHCNDLGFYLSKFASLRLIARKDKSTKHGVCIEYVLTPEGEQFLSTVLTLEMDYLYGGPQKAGSSNIVQTIMQAIQNEPGIDYCLLYKRVKILRYNTLGTYLHELRSLGLVEGYNLPVDQSRGMAYGFKTHYRLTVPGVELLAKTAN